VRYSAFISYNHRDRREAAWLHRALETYRIPKHMRGRQSRLGPLAARLPPVFQDREELAASSDLALSVRQALEDAASLIVICSPAGAASKWVNEEIRLFTALGRRERIQCLIVAGEPHASRRPGADPMLECLPPALLENGGEPLAADLRPGGDGRQMAKLKLLAGVMGVGFDELRQREQTRRVRRLAIASSALGLGFVIMSGLAGAALLARNEAVRQRDIARQKTLTAERTVEFVKSLFTVSDPSEARGETITAREILDRGALQIERGLSEEPSVRAELATTLGEVYSGLGLFQRGERLIRQGLSFRGVDPGVRVRQDLALGEAQARQGEYAAALESFGRALAGAEGETAPRPDLLPRILVGMGEAHSALENDAQAVRLLDRALALDRRRLGETHPDVARDLEALGVNDMFAGRLDAARRRVDQALAIRLETQGPLHPKVSEDLNSLAAIAYLQGEASASEAYLRRTLANDRILLGPDHPDVATTQNNLARLMIERRAYGEALPLLEGAVAIILRERNPLFDDLAFEFDNLGLARRGLGDLDGAEEAFRSALRVARHHKHRNLAPILVDLAELACSRDQAREGQAFLTEARPIMAADYPDDPWRLAWLEAVRGHCLLAAGDRAAARRALETSHPIIAARWPPTSLYGARTAEFLTAARAG